MKRLYHALLPTLVALATCAAPSCGGTGGDDAATPTSIPAAEGGTSADAGADAAPEIPADPWSVGPRFGARRYASGELEVRVRAPNATRVELCLFAKALGGKEVLRLPMDREADAFRLHLDAATLHGADLDGTIYYGLRAFGPNWPWTASFVPGTEIGFVSDVDADGNRMNPNKLLLDPYALEVSHDPINLENGDGSSFRTGPGSRATDSGPLAPKGIVVAPPVARPTGQPERPIRDDVVYEVHVRGFTKNDPTVPEADRGTYRGAASRAKYLRDLGVRVIELLPLHESPNDQNDRTPESDGDNYWGYSTLAFFAPDRRYAADKSPGGPTRELRAMVDAFHAEGIKVWVDVVFNHTAEGGANGGSATIYGFRGLDNRTYYELGDAASGYVSSNGVGPNFNTGDPVTGDLVVDSLRYWHDDLGVDGFRFDLAPIVANACTRSCYRFDAKGLPTRIAKELPARPDDGGPGVDLVAEPWGLANGSYQVGGFPKGWSEWNDHYRDTMRRSLNRLGVADVAPRELAQRVRGSADVYAGAGRPPAASIDLLVAHDGMTLADLFRYDAKNNGQAWPFGPSGGGTDSDLAYSQGGDPARQRAAARAAFALATVSAGVPMITGGDERLRTQHGNNNAYNLDSPGIWLDWTPSANADAFATFAARAFAFRSAHAALRPAMHWREPFDAKGAQVTWLRDDGQPADAAYLDATAHHFLAWSLDGASLGDDARALLVVYNSGAAS
ncbi:MAG: alpha amylase catalytic region, partial [Myxococcaceae bacterium]|nr:alpha amylase catalytic region [Myxococcaceae bacterium]